MGSTGTTNYPNAVDFVSKYENDLAHYGIPGMRWGVRRSQATLDRLAGRTPAESKKRSEKREKKWAERDKEREQIKTTKRKTKLEIKEARIKGKAELEKAKIDRKVSEAKKGTSETDRARKEEYTRKTPTDVSNPKKLSDGELSERIKRMEMEKRYATLVKESKPKTVGDTVKDFLGKEVKKHASNYASNYIDQQVKKLVGGSSHKAGATIINEAAKPKKDRKDRKKPKAPRPPREPRNRRKKTTTPPPRSQPTKTYYQTATRLDTLKEIERRRRN